MAKPLGPTGEFFRRRDEWRKPPMLSNQLRHATPGLGIALVAFGIYLVGEQVYTKLYAPSSSHHSSSHSHRKRNCIPVLLLLKMQSTNLSSGEQDFQVQKLEISDKSKGFIELLRQLSVCDSVSDKEFEQRFQEISSYGNDHLICVIEDDHS